jgi:hypothetical protein
LKFLGYHANSLIVGLGVKEEQTPSLPSFTGLSPFAPCIPLLISQELPSHLWRASAYFPKTNLYYFTVNTILPILESNYILFFSIHFSPCIIYILPSYTLKEAGFYSYLPGNKGGQDEE